MLLQEGIKAVLRGILLTAHEHHWDTKEGRAGAKEKPTIASALMMRLSYLCSQKVECLLTATAAFSGSGTFVTVLTLKMIRYKTVKDPEAFKSDTLMFLFWSGSCLPVSLS